MNAWKVSYSLILRKIFWKDIQGFWWFRARLGLSFTALIFSIFFFYGCAAKDPVTYSVEFNARWESPDIEVLDYHYGNSKYPSFNIMPGSYNRNTPQGATSISGPMHRGEFLYVKWRIKETGEVLEDKVDLKERLPRDIDHHRIHFIVRGRELYVYLISPKPNPDRFQKPPLPMYIHLKVVEIYPAQPKF